MSFLSKIFSSAGGGIIESIGNVADKFITTDKDKADFKLKMEAIVTERDNKIQDSLMTELKAKEGVIKAEMAQGDNFTKRARPSVVYFGLLVILINYVIGPWSAYFLSMPIPTIELPTEFWVGWSGIVGTWTIGRTMEKRGISNKAVDSIVGNKSIFD